MLSRLASWPRMCLDTSAALTISIAIWRSTHLQLQWHGAIVPSFGATRLDEDHKEAVSDPESRRALGKAELCPGISVAQKLRCHWARP